MTSPAWLIAGREFRAYASTASFWIALGVGPLALGGALLLTGHDAPAPATQSLTLVRDAAGRTEARFSETFPVSPAGRREVLKVLEREGRLGGPVIEAPAKPPPAVNAGAISRFALVMMLWMTLTGSLGMLLQAVVRERSNRALESLLAAARPSDLVLGKVAGVGGVSLLVVTAWLGSSLALSGVAPASRGIVTAVLHGLAQPADLLRAGGIYILAFAFYGFVTVAIGARARDNADAQNLARPMFAVLLAVFFAALFSTGGARGLDWLLYVPPFTPFMLLLGSHGPQAQVAALSGLGLGTTIAAMLAVQALKLDFEAPSLRGLFPVRPKT